MASVIKLKRSSTATSVPASLQEGELAANIEDLKLFIGGKNGGANVQSISGDQYNLTSTNGSDSATITLTVDNDSLSNDTITFSAGEGINVSESSGTITIAGEEASTSNKGVAQFSSDNFAVTSGAVTIKDGGVVNAELANKTITNAKIADGTLSSTQIAAKGISANSIADGIITSAMIANQTLTANTYADDSIALGTKTTGDYVQTITGTANEIAVTGSGTESRDVTIALPDDVTIGQDLTVTRDLAVTRNLTVDGDLTVEGALTYLSTQTLQVDDNNIRLASNNAADSVDSGVYQKYVVTGNSAVQFAGYFRDVTDGVFKFYTGLDDEPGATVNTSDTGFTIAQVDAVIDGGAY